MNWRPSKQNLVGFVAGMMITALLFWLGLNLRNTYRAVWTNRAALVRIIERVETLEALKGPDIP